MYLNQIIEAEKLAPIVPRSVAAVDTSPWMVVQYVPDAGTGGTSASIALVQGSSMTFLVDSSTPSGADAIGTNGVIDTSTAAYDTMGELVDYINGRQAWRAYLVGALRADKSSLLLAKSATACHGDNGLTFYSDTSASGDISLAISGEKFVSNGIGGHVTDDGDEVLNQLLYGSFTVTSVSAGIQLKYYSGKQGSTETQIFSTVSVTSATAKEQGESVPLTPYIEAKRGERLIMRISNASAGALTSPTVNVVGKSIVFKNDRIVDEDNW